MDDTFIAKIMFYPCPLGGESHFKVSYTRLSCISTRIFNAVIGFVAKVVVRDYVVAGHLNLKLKVLAHSYYLCFPFHKLLSAVFSTSCILFNMNPVKGFRAIVNALMPHQEHMKED